MSLLFLIVSAANLAAPAAAREQIGADAQLPPALRKRAPESPPAAGAALRAQALAKLEAQFRAADHDRNGSLTREEAKAFGFVDRHFDAIDSARRGAVSFDELRAYLEQARAGRR